jgi:hypothetical protein
MIVDQKISILEVDRELSACREFLRSIGITLSDVDLEKLLFTAEISSSIDKEKYQIELRFDNYPAWPLFIEFIHPVTGERGTHRAYPKSTDSFFHGFPCICNPSSRKAYQSHTPGAPHGDWNLIGWRDNPQVGTLKTIDAILLAIYSRINNSQFYLGRMAH